MDALFSTGAVRISTLFDWRNQGKYGEMTSDEFEGVYPGNGNLIFYDPTHARSMLMDYSVEQTEHGRIITRRSIKSPNVFTFSAASHYSDADHRKWFENEEYDACYRINSARLFFRALSKHIADAEFLFFADAEYVERDNPNHIVTGHFHPAIFKRKQEYADQREVRALWGPKDSSKELNPFVIPQSAAGQYCDPFRIIT